MPTNTTVNIILASTDQATKIFKSIGGAAKDMGKEVEGAGGAAEEAGKQTSTLGQAFAALKGPMVAAGVVAAAKAAWQLGQLGAQSLRTKAAFEAISGGASEAEERLDAMKQATRGAMNEQQMMASANQLMQMGLADSTDKLGDITEMAVRLGTAMGRDAAGSISDFSLLLANQSIPRLDTFGISAGKVRTRIAELQKETEGMTRETAFMQAVMEEGGLAMARLGDATEDEMLAFEQLAASTDDLKAAFAERLAPAVSGVARLFAEQATAIKEHRTGMDEYERGLWDLSESEEAVRERAQAMTEAQLAARDGMNEAAEAAGTMAIATEEALPAIGELADVEEKLAVSAGKVARSFGEMEFDTESMWNMALASGANVTALGELAVMLGIADKAEVEAAKKSHELAAAFGAGTISAEEYAAAMRRIGQAAEEAAQARSIYGGGMPGLQHGTPHWRGGMALVGEAGPEAVHSANSPVTRSVTSSTTYNTTINDRLAAALWMEQTRQQQMARANALM
jgi:hypothetical protein